MKTFVAPLGSYELVQEMCDFILKEKFVSSSEEQWHITRIRNTCDRWQEEQITEVLPILYEAVRTKGNFVVRIKERKGRNHITLYTQEELTELQVSLEERYLKGALTFSESVMYIKECVEKNQCKGPDKVEMLRNLVIAGIITQKGELLVSWTDIESMNETYDYED